MPTAGANGRMGRGGNAVSTSPTTGDDELSDNESINSTIVSQPDSDTQWNFERVLSEAPNEEGDPWYLIQWTGYDKDEWTWEPETNITTVGLQEWAEMKAKIDRGEAEPFDIEAWLVEAAAMKEAKQVAHRERHRKRNLKRKHQGMPMNLYDDEQEQDYDTSDAEAGGDDDANDVIPPPWQPDVSESQPRPRAELNIGGPYSDLKPKRKAPAEKAAHQERPAPPRKASTRREPTIPTTTGYQGTARKASSSARSIKSQEVGGEKTTCRTVTGNVFISGKKVQTRPKFTDAMVDPTKEARLFHNYQTTRKAELKIRDRADKAPGNLRQLGLFNISTGVAKTHTPNASGSGKTPVEGSPVQERRSSFEATKSSLKKKAYSEAFDNDKPQGERIRKKSRSVHFTGETPSSEHLKPGLSHNHKDSSLVSEPEASDSNDEELFVGGLSRGLPIRPSTTLATDSTLKKVPLRHALSRSQTQTVRKRITLGPADSQEVDVVFDDVPRTEESWNWTACLPGAESKTSPGAMIRYMVFKPNFPAAQPLIMAGGVSHKVVASNRVNIMRSMFGFDYDKLLPVRSLREPHRHDFYLAFPPNKDLMLNSVAAWLTEANPDCQLFSAQRTGDWRAFADSERKQSGTIILHETVTPLIRLFPGIGPLLHDMKNAAYTIWELGEAMQVHPPMPSIDEQSSKPGQIRLTRLFPHGSAVLLTPSFFLTQPVQATRLLSWYSKRIATPMFYVKLVVSESIVDFLQDLAHEKTSQRETLFSRQPRHSSLEALESQAKQQGITQEDCAARHEALSIVLDLIGSAEGRLMDEVQEPFIYVNDCIDANDEQSLGNWFGYWSLTKLDSYRKFHILGSHENDYSRSSRDIRIPRYAARTTGDPDLASARAGETQVAAQVPPAQDDSGARSQILGRAGGEDFAQYLSSYQFAHVRGFMKLYSYCVSWFNDSFQMADHFGDTTCRFETYRNWFSFTYPFAKQRGYNTYVAFFYTIEGPWDPAAYPKDRLPERHPWIGIWRVVNPHQQPCRATELLIWDIAAPQRVASDRSVHVGSLLPAQKALVDFVEKNSAEKNPSMAFQQVWLGGFDPPRLERSTVLDKTLEMLEIMLSGAKQWLPAPEHVLPVRGWRKVNMQHEAPATDLIEQQATIEDDSPEKIVFHAPRGNGLQEVVGRSKCGNVLFQEVSKFRLTDKTRKYMSYRFPPTMEWYTRQKAEGRHYEHINVDSWEGMFARLRIASVGGKPTHHRETYEPESSSTSAQTTPSH
ncbi:conserved hypothetical protein [Verticillium alfalfae VaMs.102]|uniref:Chromo domain-containing protein n=1 Tax=Verticillium alfalfae (strain VaMs.102 / ATCC MYA-4576 / FGSC 10136) TaxID=526221 RepID=C9SGP8_VERA1|nr:conserved hypothetical protein [Verticillium alfalfae VaMs.102]EEY17543.1 conserved hypothetical protein [Verticillium alfalfae VaMs.102]